MAPDMKEPRFGRIEKASQKNEQYYKRNVRNFLGAHLINSLNTPNFAYPAPQRSWVLFVCLFFCTPCPLFSPPFPLGPMETPSAGRRLPIQPKAVEIADVFIQRYWHHSIPNQRFIQVF